MAIQGNKLITKQMQWNANMTELNHLGKALLARPAKLMEKVDQLFSARNYYSDNPLFSALTGNKLTEKTISSAEWEWDLKGADTRPLVLLENVATQNATSGAKYGASIKLKLDEDWALPGDVLTPGAPEYQLRVIDSPKRSGTGWEYSLKLITNDINAYVPSKYLKAGTPWAKLFSVYGEGATQSGSTQFSFPLSLKNRMSKFRKHYKITDRALTEVLAVAIPDSKNNYHNFWIKYADFTKKQQWYRELERGLWFSRSTDKVLDSTGRPVTLGAGVQEQLQDSHIHRYTHLSARLLEEFLMDIFYSRIKPEQRKVIRAYTGEYGMIMISRAIADWTKKSSFVRNVEVYTNNVKSQYHSNALEAGYQFVRFNMGNGISVEVVHNPLYDDREINYEIDPITGYPIESQRITFLDFTGDSGQSNIQLVNKKDGYAMAYIEGMFGPYGPKSGTAAAHSGDFYEMHIEKTCGIHINDVSRCGELILTRNT